jgi:hypothetical protein
MQIRTEKISVKSDSKVCEIAIVLRLSVIKSSCHGAANKIRSS